MAESYKIYISSTYEDLKEQRQAALEVVRSQGQIVVAMEDYPATEQRPVDKCCEDVGNCDIFIGIYGYRYGHIPKGHKKSITHLEYEAAGEAGIPRLIFIIGDKCPWPEEKKDKNRKLINEFRKLLFESHVTTPISKITDLPNKILKSLIEVLSELKDPQAKFLKFLPYLSNRSTQEEELEEIISQCHDCLHQKPLVCIIHGDEHECHCSFVEKMQKYILPEKLILPGHRDSIGRLGINWPGTHSLAKNRFKRIQLKLFRELTGSYKDDYNTLVEALNARIAPLILNFSLNTADWQDNDPELIYRWFDFWNRLPDLAYGKKLFLFLCIKYRNTDNMPYLTARNYKKRNEKARKFLSQIDFNKYPKLHILKFTELAAIKYEELDEWVDKYAARFYEADQLLYQIEQFYKMRGITSLCMVVLVERLRELCRKTRLPCL